MKSPFKYLIDKIATKFGGDIAHMLIWTGAATWLSSGLAQIFGIFTNNNLSKKQKRYLVPQETMDMLTNIACFISITTVSKKLISKLFTTGKFAPKEVRNFLNNNEKYKNKIGKLDFNLDDILKDKPQDDVVKRSYNACKNFYTTLTTISAGIISTNIITPIIRNHYAANYLNAIDKNEKKINETKKIETQNTKIERLNQPTFSSYGLKI